jgi:hypothetical protein
MEWGPTSSLTAVEFGQMSIDDLIAFLSTPLKVDPQSMHTMEGVGRVLKEAITTNPDRFAIEAIRFERLDPTYVRSFIEGLTPAFVQNKTKEWSPVLALCQWVVTQDRDIQNRPTNALDADPNWGLTRLAIARLLSAVLSQSGNELPYENRGKVWSMLEVLADDTEPSLEYEEQYGGSNMGPATLSLNTVRSVAMHAVIRYALWVHRNATNEPLGTEQTTGGFATMPEVEKVLDDHLDPNLDPSIAVRAVYGWWLPALVSLDKDWVTKSVHRIFPAAESLINLWYGAWDTYVVRSGVYDNVYSIIKPEYRRAIDRIGSPRPTSGDLHNPDFRLAHHMMVLYWQGKISLKDPNGMVVSFFERASDTLRGQALAFIGQQLHKTKEIIPEEVRTRIQDLWSWRLSIARTDKTKDSHTKELSAFGEWFISGKFDSIWAIYQLLEALSLSNWAEPDRLVVERLAELANSMPFPVMRCFSLMAKSGRNSWYIDAWGHAPRTILSTSINSGDSAARDAAIEEVNRLGARGYLGFRDLLPK